LPRLAAAFPQLEILELVGRGGMGFVFKARQPHLDRMVALKLLPDKLAGDAQFAERFNREGRVLARLNHPNIVSVYDFGRTGGFYYLLMEYIDGVNLRQAMRAGRFSPAEALSVVPKICEALQYAHDQGILHRDIKPENILLDAKGRVKIADFGIAKLVGEDRPNLTLTNTGAALGTPHYMAPEQLESPGNVDHRADIYSLGVVFYELLTGELPIGRFAAPSAKTPVPSTVDDVVFRTLEKDRERRYQSAGEMKTQVEHLTEAGAGAGAGAGVDAGLGGKGSGDSPQGVAGTVSRWAIYGAMSVGLSLPVPLAVLVSMLAGRGLVGRGELGLTLGSVALPGLGGTLLGWLGLNEIRENGGRVRGLPLALFATLTWPLIVLLGLTLGVPMLITVPESEPSLIRLLGHFLVLVLPAGVIAFALWSVHATARWASQQPVAQRRGVLKWVFIGVLVVGMGAVLVSNPGQPRRSRPTPVVKLGTTEPVSEAGQMASWLATLDARDQELAGQFAEGHPARREIRERIRLLRLQMEPTKTNGAGLSSIRANFRIAKGQVVTYEVRRQPAPGADPIPVPWFGGYMIAPDEERGRCSLLLIPETFNVLGATKPWPAWKILAQTEDGGSVSGITSELGPLYSLHPTNQLYVIEPDSSVEIPLAGPGPAMSAVEADTAQGRTLLTLAIVSQSRRGVGPPVAATTVSVGSTNWEQIVRQAQPAMDGPAPRPGEVLASQWLKAPAGADTNAARIQFVFTGVEIRVDGGRQWLAMDYDTNIRGDCEVVFRVDGNGFKPVTRKTGLLVTPTNAPPIERHRMEWAIPEGLDAATIETFRDAVEKILVAKPFIIPAGEQRPLFRLPVGTVGDLSCAIGARLTTPPGAPPGSPERQ
jgi:predicted Ser/Thr protein kinase